ncbi:MAG: HNH endonuclease signature motif containing protein [Planctomycetota bacterium]
MRIALRTGGGRGVYELAGRQGDKHACDLFDREIFYELTPRITIPGRAKASLLQGKPRITLDEKQKTTHFYRLLAAVLLLPKPKREFKKTHGARLLMFESYSMTAIKVDVGEIATNRVVLRPTDLLLENADNLREKVDFAQRMSRIALLWEAASTQTTPFATLVQNHKQAISISNPDYKQIERRAHDISQALQTEGDPLPGAEQKLGITDLGEDARPLEPPTQFTHEAQFGVEDDDSPLQARIKRVKQWRQLAVRGAGGSRFRREVATIYNYRCLFSGQRLPRLEVTDSTGVDAAHILPWSTHDINSPRNGLCLNKLCHWAFDEGVLRLRYEQKAATYILEVPDEVRTEAARATFDIDYFDSLTGPLPVSRLPANQAAWPSVTYLAELNRFMGGQVR